MSELALSGFGRKGINQLFHGLELFCNKLKLIILVFLCDLMTARGSILLSFPSFLDFSNFRLGNLLDVS